MEYEIYINKSREGRLDDRLEARHRNQREQEILSFGRRIPLNQRLDINAVGRAQTVLAEEQHEAVVCSMSVEALGSLELDLDEVRVYPRER